MMDEARLIEKLRLIEALFSGAATAGERVAAERARERILERLRFWEEKDPPLEYRFTMDDMWSRKVFVALLRRYGITPYRYERQRYTTVMAKVPKKFVDETLWPEFEEISDTLESYLSEVTDRVVSQVIHQDSSEAEVVSEPPRLPRSTAPPPVDASVDTARSEIFSPQAQNPSHPQEEKEGMNAPSSMTADDNSSKNQRKKKRRKRRKRR